MIDKIKELRNAIRYHRDQVGDDRCWIDDYKVWNALPEIKQRLHLPTYDEGMRRCRNFFKHRNADSADKVPADAILDPTKWDEDLAGMSTQNLSDELNKLENAIKEHAYIAYRERTFEDDQILYSVLPEKIPADFRLPSEEDFLGVREANAGCPQFWNSHKDCPGEHNIHQWGPCKKA